MNPLTFIKTLFQKLFGKVGKVVLKHSEKAVKVVQVIKSIVENPLVTAATTFIPGKLDNDIVDYAKDNVNEVLGLLNGIYAFTDPNADKEVLIDKFAEFVRLKSKGERIDVWTRLAAELAKYSLETSEDGKKISIGEGYALTQLAFEALFGKKATLDTL